MPKVLRDALTALFVRTVTKTGRYADGNGLYLLVDASGNRRWVLRTVIGDKRTDMGLGSTTTRSLKDARAKAAEYRGAARDGRDPIAERRQNKGIPTFKEAAELVHTSNESTWRNAKHRAQWINTLTEYAFPHIGSKRVDRIETADVLRVLSPIWTTKPETARRVRQRIGTVMDWAKAAGHRKGDNPVLGVREGLPKQTAAKAHHAALAYQDVPAFVTALRESDSGDAVKGAFEFLILNAARTGEVIGATVDEVDVDAGEWTIQASRMKAKRAHRVPLATRSLEIVEKLHNSAVKKSSGFLFAGRDSAPLSNMVFLMTLRRMKYKVTAHGFRSAFRDWAAETTNFPREVCEAALAHSNKDKVEAAYLRSDLFEQRRALMGQWATFCTTPAKAGKVVKMQRKTAT
jgi:integrase